jgi:SAM-dependent methyltransferase
MFVNCDIEKLPFRNNSFDLVFGSAVLHHFFDPEKGMAEICLVLKKGGRYISTYEMALNGLFKFFWSRFGTPGMVSKETGVRENVYSFKEWEYLFKNAGFKDFEMPLERDWQYMKPHWFNSAYYKFMSFFPDFVPKLIGSGVGFTAKKT